MKASFVATVWASTSVRQFGQLMRSAGRRLESHAAAGRRAAVAEPSRAVPLSERDRAAGGYNRAARAMHWLVAALAVMVVAFGWAMEAAARNTPARGNLLLLHGSIGLTILAVMIARVLWRWRHPAPVLPPTLTRLEVALAHLSHFGLYLVFIGMPLAGYVNAAAQGHAVSLFGTVSIPPLLPIDQRVAQAAIAVHLVGQYLVYLLVAAHVGAALFHGIVKRDGVLERMLPRRSSA
jgi:cytochrome b561